MTGTSKIIIITSIYLWFYCDINVYVTGNVCNQGSHVMPGEFREYVKSLIALGIT